jgi:lysine N6-hydroxylase
VNLQTNTQVQRATASGQGVELQLYHQEQQRDSQLNTGAVVFATGFEYQPPEFLAGINQRIARDEQGRFAVGRNYAIDHQGNEIYVQNAELHTHGFVTPDLGMACYRNAWLIRELSGVEHYPIEQRIAFQQFGVADHALTKQVPETELG